MAEVQESLATVADLARTKEFLAKIFGAFQNTDTGASLDRLYAQLTPANAADIYEQARTLVRLENGRLAREFNYGCLKGAGRVTGVGVVILLFGWLAGKVAYHPRNPLAGSDFARITKLATNVGSGIAIFGLVLLAATGH